MSPILSWFCALILLLAIDVFALEKPDFSGEWNIDKENSADIPSAIETCVSNTNFIIRAIARHRLKKTNTVHEKVFISTSASSITITFGSEVAKPVIAPVDGSVVPWERDDGEVFLVSHQLTGDRLVETFRGDDGQKEIDFSVSADGAVLTMAITASSPRLPEPLVYQLVYSRVR